MQTTSPGKKDFESFRASGRAPGVTLSIGSRVASMRDRLAMFLVGLGVTPNGLTLTGFVFTLVGCWFLLRAAGHALPIDPFAPSSVNRSWDSLIAMAWFFMSAACDMLDGAVARLGKLHSSFGAVLDSTVDRFSDVAVWGACLLYFAAQANVTYCLLVFLALANTFLISYIKARAEDLIPDCTVGFWQRGERFMALLIACAMGHLPTLIWLQAILPFFTVLRRINYTSAYLRAVDTGGPLPERGIGTGWRRYVLLWRYPRGSVGFDIVVGANIAVLVAGPFAVSALYGTTDPVRDLLQYLHAW